MPVTIARATIDDAEIIATISRQTFYDSFASQNTEADMQKHLDEFYAVSKMQEELSDPLQLFFLAKENDQVLGYLKINLHEKEDAKDLHKPIELERIYAVKEAIGKGVGKVLMQQCIDFALQQQKQTIWLGVWEHNHRAIDFYTKFGFQKFGTHVFMVGDDPQTDWLMKKTIG